MKSDGCDHVELLQPVCYPLRPQTVEQVALQAAYDALALPNVNEVKLLITRAGPDKCQPGRVEFKLIVESRPKAERLDGTPG
jgi:hypothetical protein